MLNKNQKIELNKKAKEELRKILQELNISKFIYDTGNLVEILDNKIASLVTQKEIEKIPIDEELLEIYNLILDIIINNEDNLDFLNNLFFS